MTKTKEVRGATPADWVTRTARNRARSEANRFLRERLPGHYRLLFAAHLAGIRDPNSPTYRPDLKPSSQHTLAAHRAHAELRDGWPELWAAVYPAAVKRHVGYLWSRFQ